MSIERVAVKAAEKAGNYIANQFNTMEMSILSHNKKLLLQVGKFTQNY